MFRKSIFGFLGAMMGAQMVCAATPRNVVMIVTDDMGYADTGITGVKDFATPNIDSIATDGVFCRQAYVTCAVCSPSRAGFLTGRYQQRFGHEHNGGGPPPFGLPLDQVTIANHFKAAGYKTGAIGKWHLGETDAHHPMSRGFDEFVGMLGGGHGYFHDAPKSKEGGQILDGRKPVEWNEYLTTYFGKRAVDFIGRHKSEPFFLYLSFNAPHTPMQAREQDLAKVAHIENERRRKYAAMMLAVDEAVGEVLRQIKTAGIEQETIVVFFSDNGGPQQGDPSANGSRNWPFRSGKAQYFEGGIHVPMFVKIPGVVKPGTQYDQPVISLDLLPTLLAAVGKQPIANAPLDGKNLIPHLTGETTAAPHERLYWRTGAAFAMIEGDWKIVWPRREGGMAENPERPDFSKTQLYRLRADASEKTDLAKQEPERVKAMIDAWQSWDRDLASPLWGTWKDKKVKDD